MNRPIPNGLLVAVEGIDGAGKTSTAGLLTQWCGERGLGCAYSKEPTSLQWGRELRNSAKEGRLSLERELELFRLDRADHVRRCIQPSLAEGNIVILDRYYWSSAAYQGSRGVDFLEIIQANELFCPRPDLVILLDVEVDAGLQRIRMRGDQPNAFEAKTTLNRARQIFLQLAEKNENAVQIDTSGHFRETVAQALLAFQTAAIRKIHQSGLADSEKADRIGVFYGGEPFEDPVLSVP